MDYKYIEQLLERYWKCETSLAEERILRAFFSQEEVPAHLAKYQALFGYEQQESQQGLSDDFDQKMFRLIEKPEAPKEVVKAQRMTLNYRLRPLYRAVATVAIFLMVGGAVQQTFNGQRTTKGWDYNASNYQDTYKGPQEAFEAGMGGIEEIQDLLRTVPSAKDSIKEALSKR